MEPIANDGPVEELPLSFESPESGSISGASYDPDTRMLSVEFKHGEQYHYGDIEPSIWREFVMAASRGRHFATHIRPLFAGKRVKSPSTKTA